MKKDLFSRTGLVMLVLAAALLVWLAIDLLLLVFVGILLAVFLYSLADMLAERTPLSSGWALLVVILLLLGTAVGAGFLVAPSLAQQTRELAETLPEAVKDIEEQIRRTDSGGWLLDRFLERSAEDPPDPGVKDEPSQQQDQSQAAGQEQPPGGDIPQLKDAQDAVVQHATGAATRLLDGLVALVVVIFVGVYLASDPQPYIRGLLRLFPVARRHRIGETLYACGYTLRWWIFGQLLAMAVVGLLMGVGLAIIGVPLAFALGVLAGLFEFIPTIGPLLGLAPAMLLALTDSPTTALWVLGLYSIVQTIESYLLTPLVQQRVVHMPPVVTIVSQVFFAWTVGPIGLVVAVPLIAVVMVIVQMLYVGDFLGDDIDVDAEEQGRIEHEEAEPLTED